MLRRIRRLDTNQAQGTTVMKRIIPLLIGPLLLAGCGNNSSENQSSPANPPASEQPSNSGAPAETNNNTAAETATNNSPATNSGGMSTNGSAGAN
jgi:uncharacterized lipoprotein YajG